MLEVQDLGKYSQPINRIRDLTVNKTDLAESYKIYLRGMLYDY
jgi:hypothetical protein